MLKKLISESAIYGIAVALNQLVPLLLWPAYTRVFEASDLGNIVLVTTILTGLSIFVTLGLDNSAHRWFWETNDSTERKITINTWFWAQSFFSFFAMIIVLIIINILKFFGSIDSLFFNACLFTAFLLPLKSIFIILNNWFRMQRLPFMVLFVNLGVTIATVVITFIFISVKKNWTGVFEALFYAHLIFLAIAFYPMSKSIHWKWFNWDRFRVMMKYAIPLVPAALATWLMGYSDRWLLTLYLPRQEVGIYQLSVFTAMVVGFPVLAFQQAWSPFALSIHTRADAQSVYVRVATLFTLSLSVLASLVSIASPYILTLLFSDKFVLTSDIVVYLAFTQVLVGLYYIFALGVNLAKSTRPIAASVIIGATIQVLLNVLLIPEIGRKGAAISFFIAQSLSVLYLYRASQKLFYIPFNVKLIVGYFLSLFVLSLFVTSFQF